MNSNRILTATFMTTAALMIGSAPASAMQADDFGTTTERERGIVMECRGESGGLQAYASVYDNNRYGSYLQVVLGDPDDGNGRSKQVRKPLLQHGQVRGAVTIDGHKAKVRGTAKKVGEKSPVHEVIEDAGYTVTSDGSHRQLADELVLSYDGQLVPLTCDPAFAYDLQVTKTPIG